MCGLLHSPPFVLAYQWANVGPQRGATHHTACPILCHSESGPLSLSVWEFRAAGSASGQTAGPVCPTLRQSPSCHSNASPLCPSCPSPPLLPVWMNVYFLSPWCPTSLPLDFLLVLVVFCFQIVVVFLLVVQGGKIYLHLHLGQKSIIPLRFFF